MIEYVVPGNTDPRILRRSCDILKGGSLIAFPTDTSWTIGCALSSKSGIQNLRRLSGERDERHFTLLCHHISQIGNYCSLNNSQFRLIKRLTPGPYVFILRALLGTEKVLDIRRKEVGVRIPHHPVSLALGETLGEPLYSITAKRSMIQRDRSDSVSEEFPESADERGLPPIPEEELFEGGWELEDISAITLILDSGEELPRRVSTVIDLTGDEPTLIRYGAGPWPI
ncbi:MAG: L-threonylcarbamoyladenylate synthase [Treponemataceae bacterium]|nr:L-threonylcarbamoyladenylate synthase [Treponemataceae bacterium]